MKKLTIAIICLLALSLPLYVSAAQPDSTQVYAFSSNTTTMNNQDSYYHFDRVRAGVRAYKDDFLIRMEYDFSVNALKYSYLEYSSSYQDWKFGGQFGRQLMPVMWNFPSPSTQPMPRQGYAFDDLSVYGVGVSAYAQHGAIKAQFLQFGYQQYGANLRVGPLSAFWTKGEGQGLAFLKSYNHWVNLYSVWTNYQDREGRLFPDRRNAAFIENHIRLGDRVRVYLHEDFGDLRGTFIGGLSYMLFPNDKENTLSVFYDSANLWQVRLTFSFSQMFSNN